MFVKPIGKKTRSIMENLLGFYTAYIIHGTGCLSQLTLITILKRKLIYIYEIDKMKLFILCPTQLSWEYICTKKNDIQNTC